MNRDTLTQYIIEERWKEFFTAASSLCEYQSDRDTVLSIQMRLNRLEKDRSLGIVSFENYQIEISRIRVAAMSMLDKLDWTKSVTVNASVADVTVNSTVINNFGVPVPEGPDARKTVESDPFYIAPIVLKQLEQFMGVMRKFIILAAQANMVLPDIFEACTEAINEIQEMAMSFVTSENSEERDEYLESLDEYINTIEELEKQACKELKKALGSEKNQVAQILKEVKVGNKKNMDLFKAAYKVFEQLNKHHLVKLPSQLPVNGTSLGLLVKKWIKLANS